MSIFKSLFFKINTNARDVKYYLNEVLTKEGFQAEYSFVGSVNHVVYSKGDIDFDFWWETGNRPTLFLRRNGESIKTTVYENLIQKHAPRETVGGKIYFIYSKLDKEVYYKEHELFILDYIKNN